MIYEPGYIPIFCCINHICCLYFTWLLTFAYMMIGVVQIAVAFGIVPKQDMKRWGDFSVFFRGAGFFSLFMIKLPSRRFSLESKEEEIYLSLHLFASISLRTSPIYSHTKVPCDIGLTVLTAHPCKISGKLNAVSRIFLEQENNCHFYIHGDREPSTSCITQ